jgi:hypothetical protein
MNNIRAFRDNLHSGKQERIYALKTITITPE